MATADAGKRRSSGGEDKDVSGSGKKKRRRSRSRAPSAERGTRYGQLANNRCILISAHHTRHLGSKKKSRKKKKEKNRERKGGRLKVQSIAELAELVKSGQVQIPRSLVEYQSDKLQLLDQVFAILSPDDVKGMLPDILKVCVESESLCPLSIDLKSTGHVNSLYMLYVIMSRNCYFFY